MKIARTLSDDEIKVGEVYTAPPPTKPQKPEPQIGDILSYDAQPRVIGEVYPERQKRVYARVSALAAEGNTRYTRLSYIRSGDWQDFATDTIQQRITRGEMELVDKWNLLKLIAQAFADEGQSDISMEIQRIIEQHQKIS